MSFFRVRQGAHCLFFILFFYCLSAVHLVVPGNAVAAPLLLADTQRNDPPELCSLLKALAGKQSTVIAIQRELVSRPAVGPEYGGAGEEEKARWVESWLVKHGAAFERLDFPDERVPTKVRPNIVAVYPAEVAPPAGAAPSAKAEGRTLWLFSHLDVAVAGPRELWKGDPFALRVEGDSLYGRGTEDNNQAITAGFLLLEALRESGSKPPLRLGLVFTSGALADYTVGIGHLFANKPDLFKPDDLFVVMDYGNRSGNLVSVAEKGNLWLKVTVTGKSGHAGRPDTANNAFAAAAALAHGLRELEQEFPTENPLFTPPRTTFTPTRTEDPGTGVNHIPGKFVFFIDVRITPEYSFDAVEKAVQTLAGVTEKSDGVSIAIERVEETPASTVAPAGAPVLAALGRAISAQFGTKPEHVGTGSVTVAASLRAKGLQAVAWGVQETAHNAPEERALISDHIKQAQILARILFDPELVKTDSISASVRNGQ